MAVITAHTLPYFCALASCYPNSSREICKPLSGSFFLQQIKEDHSVLITHVPPDPFISVFVLTFLDKNLREIATLTIFWMAFKNRRKINPCLSRGCSRFWTWQLHLSQPELWWLNAAEHSLADERHCNMILEAITEGFGWISQWNLPNFILRTPPFWSSERHHLVSSSLWKADIFTLRFAVTC